MLIQVLTLPKSCKKYVLKNWTLTQDKLSAVTTNNGTNSVAAFNITK